MFSKISHLFIGLTAVTGVACASSKSFGLYAYGNDISGLPLYYSDGNAVISKQTPTNGTTISPVVFNPPESTSLVGNPNTTNSTGVPDFTNSSLFVPGSSSDSKQVGFSDEPGSDQVANKFVWYGNFLLVEDDAGDYTSLFSVKKSASDTGDGEYSLLWNVTDSDDTDEEVVSITMRSVAPSNED